MRLCETKYEKEYETLKYIAMALYNGGGPPLVFQCHACMMMANLEAPEWLASAQEAVSVAEDVMEQTKNPLDIDRMLLERAQECLEEAQASFKKHCGYQEEAGEEVLKGEGDILADGEGIVGPDGAVETMPTTGQQRTTVERLKKMGKVRVDIAGGTVQCQDPDTMGWVQLEDVEFV